MFRRWRFGPVAASIFAGFLGAGVLDFVVTIARASGATAPAALFALAIGIYGTAGLIAGAVIGVLVAGVLRAVPGGAAGLLAAEHRDRTTAAGLLAGAVGIVVVAVVAALGQRVLVRPMQSDKLATIAAGGLVILAAPIAAAIAIAILGPLGRRVAPRLPRPARTGATGLLLLGGVGVGVLAAVAAFSRADWRVLDLGPFVALAAATVTGVAHAIFWYRSAPGRRLAPRVPATALSAVAAGASLLALVVGARLPEASPAFHAADEGSMGLRMGLRVARAATDGDGDGFSARFGGGDCDDHRADVYPGAEDIPGNGIDENCEGGDAVASADSEPTSDDEPGDTAAGHAAAAVPVPGGGTARGPHDDQGATTRGATAGAGASARAGAPAAARNGNGSGKRFDGNILIVSIDAFRADRLGVAGYTRPPGHSLTPNLDALAKRGAYFRRAWSQAPNTPRSFPSILTSQFPSAVKWDKPTVNYPIVLPSNHTFFEDLRAAGLAPIGIFSHFYFTPDRGISRAFKEWSNDGAGTIAESNKDSASPRIVPRVLARLKKAATTHERFVLWTHLFEPHSSYMPHKEFPSSGATGVAGLMEKYDHEIAFVDLWVGKVLKALGDLGLAGNTAVVIMADHGEAWGEHKAFFHGQDLFDEQLRIPLILAVPGHAPVVSDDPVAAVDVAPTLVDLVGGQIPKSFRGRSLLPAIDGQSLPARPIYGELMPATAWPHHAVMMIDANEKIIHRVSERRWELYDLARDPGEMHNLADDSASRATFDRMRRQVLGFEERKH